MRNISITKVVYQFYELSEEAKEVALTSQFKKRIEFGYLTDRLNSVPIDDFTVSFIDLLEECRTTEFYIDGTPYSEE